MRALVATVLAGALLAGCGGDKGPASGPDTPARAAQETGNTKTGLDRALSDYRDGDRGGAQDEFKKARDNHFVLVEKPLRAVDATLADTLHSAFYSGLPHLLDEGVTVSQLAKTLALVETQLDDATAKLAGP